MQEKLKKLPELKAKEKTILNHMIKDLNDYEIIEKMEITKAALDNYKYHLFLKFQDVIEYKSVFKRQQLVDFVSKPEVLKALKLGDQESFKRKGSEADIIAPKPLEPKLSPHENNVLYLLSIGLTYKQITTRLFIANSTVSTHVNVIFEKLNVNDRTQAVLYAINKGLYGSKFKIKQEIPIETPAISAETREVYEKAFNELPEPVQKQFETKQDSRSDIEKLRDKYDKQKADLAIKIGLAYIASVEGEGEAIIVREIKGLGDFNREAFKLKEKLSILDEIVQELKEIA